MSTQKVALVRWSAFRCSNGPPNNDHPHHPPLFPPDVRETISQLLRVGERGSSVGVSTSGSKRCTNVPSCSFFGTTLLSTDFIHLPSPNLDSDNHSRTNRGPFFFIGVQSPLVTRPDTQFWAMAPVTDETVESLRNLVKELESRVDELEASVQRSGGKVQPRTQRSTSESIRMILMGPPGAGSFSFCLWA